MIRDHMIGAADNSGRIWTLMQFELWLRTWIDHPRVQAPMALSVA